MLHLKIKLLQDSLSEFYANHSTFHQDDAGLDLFCPEDIIVNPGKQVAIKLGIACEPSSSYFLVPRSSISKTPLRFIGEDVDEPVLGEAREELIVFV